MVSISVDGEAGKPAGDGVMVIPTSLDDDDFSVQSRRLTVTILGPETCGRIGNLDTTSVRQRPVLC